MLYDSAQKYSSVFSKESSPKSRDGFSEYGKFCSVQGIMKEVIELEDIKSIDDSMWSSPKKSSKYSSVFSKESSPKSRDGFSEYGKFCSVQGIMKEWIYAPPPMPEGSYALPVTIIKYSCDSLATHSHTRKLSWVLSPDSNFTQRWTPRDKVMGTYCPMCSDYAGRNADALALYFGEDPARCPFDHGSVFYSFPGTVLMIKLMEVVTSKSSELVNILQNYTTNQKNIVIGVEEMGDTFFINPLYEQTRMEEGIDMEFLKNDTSGTLPKEDNELTLDLFSRGSLSTPRVYGYGRQDVLVEENNQGYLGSDMAHILLGIDQLP
ncbi:hypothetical protein RND71_021891 [Anisodus tanguticus]|uniref:Uncharacterized protein n=1 Tax=Anisodus tanguticus TaxID=243964 RepID=A0AAE1V8M9_9SOLA|nr:hypothetical protein RND71_021891 [Anisodus tanguticus]